MERVAIIGAGTSGLSSAVLLEELCEGRDAGRAGLAKTQANAIRANVTGLVVIVVMGLSPLIRRAGRPRPAEREPSGGQHYRKTLIVRVASLETAP